MQAKASEGAQEGGQQQSGGSEAPGGAPAPIQNWAELYAIVGSLFDSGMSVTDHLAMLQHLPDKQRCGICTP